MSAQGDGTRDMAQRGWPVEVPPMVCGECGSDDVTIPADGSEIFCHSCETSYALVPIAVDGTAAAAALARVGDSLAAATAVGDVDALRRSVVELLVARGVKAEHWHSGGGIFGIRIVAGSGADLFATLEADTPAVAWIGADLCRADGELVAGVELQVRPFGSDWAPASTPDEIADAFAELVGLLR